MEKNKSLDSDLPISKEKMPLAQRLKAGFPKIVDNTKRVYGAYWFGLS